MKPVGSIENQVVQALGDKLEASQIRDISAKIKRTEYFSFEVSDQSKAEEIAAELSLIELPNDGERCYAYATGNVVYVSAGRFGATRVC